MLPFASSTDGQGINEPLLREYAFFLANKAEGTIEAYLRTARQVMIWAASRPGNGGVFQPQHLTKTAVEMYLASLEREGLSLLHRARVKSALSTFARWLIEEKGLLQKNPTRGIDLPAIQTLALSSALSRMRTQYPIRDFSYEYCMTKCILNARENRHLREKYQLERRSRNRVG